MRSGGVTGCAWLGPWRIAKHRRSQRIHERIDISARTSNSIHFLAALAAEPKQIVLFTNERLSESALLTVKSNLRHVPHRLARGSNVHS